MKSLKLKHYSQSYLLSKALEREREAKEKSEYNLEMKSVMLGHLTSKLKGQLELVTKRNKEVSYLNSLAWILHDGPQESVSMSKFLEITMNFTGWKYGLYIPVVPEEKMDQVIDVYFQEYKYSRETCRQKCKEKLVSLKDQAAKKYYVLNDYDLSMVVFPLVVGEQVVSYIFFISTNQLQVSDTAVEVVSNGVFQLVNYFEKMLASIELKKNFEELQVAQKQLVHSEKMASLGVIVSGVAHEINNPLSFVLSNIEMLNKYFLFLNDIAQKNSLVISEDEKKEFDFIKSDFPLLMSETLAGIHRVKDIVSDLKTFSHADDKEKKYIRIEDCIDSALKVANSEFKNKCKVQKYYTVTHEVFGFPGQLVQVFTNLLVNAAHAIEEYGAIYITTSEEEGMVIVKVRDEGVGISEENLKNIFTPFFTTKKIGKGTGLGLSISYGIIKKHNGAIEVMSREHIGTEFIVKIPIGTKEHL